MLRNFRSSMLQKLSSTLTFSHNSPSRKGAFPLKATLKCFYFIFTSSWLAFVPSGIAICTWTSNTVWDQLYFSVESPLYVLIFSISDDGLSSFLGGSSFLTGSALGYSTFGASTFLTGCSCLAASTLGAGSFSSSFFAAAYFSRNAFHLSSSSGLWGKRLKCYSWYFLK